MDAAGCRKRSELSILQTKQTKFGISWDALDPRTLATRLGPNVHRATLTLIVEGGGNEEPIRLSLGDTSEVIDGLPHIPAAGWFLYP